MQPTTERRPKGLRFDPRATRRTVPTDVRDLARAVHADVLERAGSSLAVLTP